MYTLTQCLCTPNWGLLNSASILYIDQFEKVTPKQCQILRDINVMDGIDSLHAVPVFEAGIYSGMANMSLSQKNAIIYLDGIFIE